MSTKLSERPRLFVNKVHFKGFKSIEDLTIDFQENLNILIGKNGSGKSNFMECMYQAMRSNRNNIPLYNYSKIEFISSDDHVFFVETEKSLRALDIKEENFVDRLDLFDNRTEFTEKFTIDKNLIFDSSKNNKKTQFEFNGKTHNYRSTFRIMFITLGYQSLYPTYIKFDLPYDSLECINVPGTMKIDLESPFFNWKYPKTLSFIDDTLYEIEMMHDGDLAKPKAINKININKILKFKAEIKENLKTFTSIEDVRYNNINLYNDEKSIIIENIKIDFKIKGNWMPWSQLSDGTKRLFYIVSEVTNSTGLILIEEPELGIHPHQFSLLMDFLKEQSLRKQIIISTHSPKALDHLNNDELNNILITYYDSKKGTQLRHLSKKEYSKAQKYMKEVGFFSDYWMLSDLE